jgi:hypothetical protein
MFAILIVVLSSRLDSRARSIPPYYILPSAVCGMYILYSTVVIQVGVNRFRRGAARI